MSKKKNIKNSRDAPVIREAMSSAIFCNPGAWDSFCADGYRPLTECPEVQMCAGVYADLIGSMTLHLMRNTDHGDERVKNSLSRKLDINPNADMTRQTFMSLIVWTLLLDGRGNQVTFPKYSSDGYLEDLIPLPPTQVSFAQNGSSYVVRYGDKTLSPDEVLHFVLRPDPYRPYMGMGHNVSLTDVVKSLRKTTGAKNSIMSSPAPSVIVKVDGLSEGFSSATGRRKLAEQYVNDTEAGRPWFIPSETFSVEQVKPLTLNDLAIKTSLELDKRSVAAIYGVPPFLVGVGDFKRDEFNWFISARVMPRAKAIEQELTKKTLLSPDLYWRFNHRSLYNYDIGELVNAGSAMVDRMAMRRNEWRDWVGLPPDEEMNELLALENYVPADRLGDQKKLKGGGEGDAG